MSLPKLGELALGTESRAWVHGDATEAPPPCCDFDTMSIVVRVRDGVHLSGVAWVPKKASQVRFPCVVATNGYSALDALIQPQMIEIARQGFATALVRLRGVPPSEGRAGLYESYEEDTYDVIEWLAKQPFCNGKVGMTGTSMLALSQWLAARAAPPSLAVIIPDDSVCNSYDLWYPGGMAPGPGRVGRAEMPGVVSEYAEAVKHPWLDDFWRARSLNKSDVEAIGRSRLPILMSTGWDSYLCGVARYFSFLRRAGSGNHAKLIIGPWSHDCPLACIGTNAANPAGSMIRPRTGFAYTLLWLRRWLMDDENGVEQEPSVLIWIAGRNQWRFEQDWPLPDEKRRRLFLVAQKSGTSRSVNDGALRPNVAMASGHAAYNFNPATACNPAASLKPVMHFFDKPDPATGKLFKLEFPDDYHLRTGPDKTLAEETALTWTSAPLEFPTEITGYARVAAWASVSRSDADFVWELTEVEATGPDTYASRQVTRAYLRASHAFSRSAPTALQPDDIYRFEAEFLPTAHVFKAGSRIRLTLQGCAIDPSNAECWEGPGLNPHSYEMKIFSGPEYASFVELPFIGAVPEFN